MLLAGAAGAAGVGIYFGSDSRNARILFGRGVGNGDPVVGLSRQDALALDARVRNGGLLANTMFGVAGGLALAGLAVLIFGPNEPVTTR